jgi:hypothetical protein
MVYHGSGELFNHIDLNKCSGYRDFGRGLYLSIEYWHAESIANRRARNTGNGYVYIFKIPKTFSNTPLKIKTFRGPSEAWVDFIIDNRKSECNNHNYDIVIGPTADNSTNTIIKKYLRGDYGKVGSLRAKKLLISLLKPKVYPTQICICTQLGLNYLRYITTNKIF